MTKQSIESSEHGVIVLKASGKEYVCTAFQMSMGLNEIPTAVVTIGSGVGLHTPSTTQNAEDLLSSVLSKRSSAYLDMIECEIEERLTGKTVKIFEGCITTGTTVYKAGTRTVKAIRFMCMNKVCKLIMRPLSEYVTLEANTLINYIGTLSSFSVQDAMSRADLFKQGRVGVSYLLGEIAAKIEQATIDKRVAYVMSAILKAGSYRDQLKNIDGTETGILDYIYSDHGLDTSLGHSTLNQYNVELCSKLFQVLQHGSIIDAIVNVLTSDEFMLQLTPQFSDKQFKIKIEPSEAWVKKESVKITEKHMNSIMTSYDPIAHVNTPDAFVVNYAEAVSMLANETPNDFIGLSGVYSDNPTLKAALKSVYQSGNRVIPGSIKSKMYRACIYYAPKWLYPGFSNTAKGDPPKSVRDHRRKDSSKDGDEKKTPKLDKSAANALADKIAQAIFTLKYGRQDTTSITLLPSLRFGLTSGIEIEKHLGYPMDVSFTDGSKSLNIRGTISHIDYNYATDGTSNCSYTVGLTRVRPLNEDEQSVECPLYKEMKG